MTLGHTRTGTAIALAFVLAGCTQQRFGSLRGDPEVASGPPTPATALFMPSSPALASAKPDDKIEPIPPAIAAKADYKIEQTSFIPKRESPTSTDPAPQMVESPLSVLYQRAAQRYATMDTYIFRLKRREVVAGKKQPEELIRVSVRIEPYSVHLRWLGAEGKGREALYVKGKFKNEMQVLLAPSDLFSSLMPRTSMAPDSPLVRDKSRYAITETGFGSLITRFGRMAAALEKGDTSGGTAKYLGRVPRPEFTDKVEAVHQVLPAGADALLPKGGQRWWFFDAGTGLPVLVVTNDPSGEVEYYCHDHIISPANLDDNDFNPEWLRKK